MTWYSFRIDLPKEIASDWSNVKWTVFSFWGNGGPSTEHWGWPEGHGEYNFSTVLTDKNGAQYIVINLITPGVSEAPSNGHFINYSARAVIGDDHFVLGGVHKKA